MTQKTKAQSLEIWKDCKTGDWDFTALQYRIHNCENNKGIAGEKWLDSVSQHLREHEFKPKKGYTLKELTENSLKEKGRESEEKEGNTPQ